MRGTFVFVSHFFISKTVENSKQTNTTVPTSCTIMLLAPKRSTVVFLACLLTTQAKVSAAAAEATLEPIVSFQPKNSVDDYLNIARDLGAMKGYLLANQHTVNKENKEQEETLAFHNAFEVYSKGGYAASAAEVKLHTALHFHIDRGTTLTALSNQGQHVHAVTTQKYNKGDTVLHLRYRSDLPCHVGGLRQPQNQGCFRPTGHLTVSGHSDTLYYVENTSFNNRTLQAFSTSAQVAFRPHGQLKHDLFQDFAVFDEYYGAPNFADEMIRAAMHGRSHEFRHFSVDFSGTSASYQERAVFMETSAAYLSAGLYVMRELDTAMVYCESSSSSDGKNKKDTNSHALHSLDAAVALYTGALAYGSHGGGGNNHSNGHMLFGLANDMCQHFNTCGKSGRSIFGTAKVNHDIFGEFDAMQKHLVDGHCWAADKAKEHIVRLMFVPLFQGLIYSAFETKKGESGDAIRAQGAVFAAATMPRLADCSLWKAKRLHGNFLPGQNSPQEGDDDFASILSTLQDHYECLDLTCEEIGGIWDRKNKRYHQHAPPCSSTHTSKSSSSSGSSGATSDKPLANQDSPTDTGAPAAWVGDEGPRMAWIIGGVVGAVAVIAMCAGCSMRRNRQWKRKRQQQDKNLVDGLIAATNSEDLQKPTRLSSTRPVIIKCILPPDVVTETETVNSTEDLHDITDQLV